MKAESDDTVFEVTEIEEEEDMEVESENDVTVVEVTEEQVDVQVEDTSCTEFYEKIIESEMFYAVNELKKIQRKSPKFDIKGQ